MRHPLIEIAEQVNDRIGASRLVASQSLTPDGTMVAGVQLASGLVIRGHVPSDVVDGESSFADWEALAKPSVLQHCVGLAQHLRQLGDALEAVARDVAGPSGRAERNLLLRDAVVEHQPTADGPPGE